MAKNLLQILAVLLILVKSDLTRATSTIRIYTHAVPAHLDLAVSSLLKNGSASVKIDVFTQPGVHSSGEGYPIQFYVSSSWSINFENMVKL